MPRGGKTNPSPRQPPSGPGRYSRRTEGQQVATPGIGGPGPGGESSLQSGDIQRLEAAQAAAPLPSGVMPPRAGPPAVGASPQGPSGGGIPPHLLAMDSRRPGEPTTAGLPLGAGPGPEALSQPPPLTTEEATLMMLVREFGDQGAQAMLDRIQREKMAQQSQLMPTTAPGPSAPTIDEMGMDLSAEVPEPGPAGPENVPPPGA